MEGLLRFTGAVAHDPAITAWCAARPGALGELGRQWFARLRAAGPDVRELLHDGCPTVCIDDAPFAYVGVFTAHVNVGFFHGAALPDPARLLLGNGKRMRHVKLLPGTAPDAAALAALIASAYADLQARLRAGP